MPTGYVLIVFWAVVAVGAALFLGTAAALVRDRAGALPDPHAGDGGRVPSSRQTRRAMLRCVLGLCLTVFGFAGLVASS